jgi:hypothetical protein
MTIDRSIQSRLEFAKAGSIKPRGGAGSIVRRGITLLIPRRAQKVLLRLSVSPMTFVCTKLRLSKRQRSCCLQVNAPNKTSWT